MLDDLLETNLRPVICGTAAGQESASRQSYYAHSTNVFWRTLHEVGLTPIRLRPDEYRRLHEYGIGLSDFVKAQAGADSALAKESFDIQAFKNKTLRYQAKVVCFNGKNAAKKYFGMKHIEHGVHPVSIGASCTFVAPSTSGRASQFFRDSRNHWLDLARIVKT